MELFLPSSPLFKRAKADKGGLSGFFCRHFLHYAYFQPLASQKTRSLRHLIPMVRNSGVARNCTTLYVGFDVRRIKLPLARATQYATLQNVNEHSEATSFSVFWRAAALLPGSSPETPSAFTVARFVSLSNRQPQRGCASKPRVAQKQQPWVNGIANPQPRTRFWHCRKPDRARPFRAGSSKGAPCL